MAVQRGRGRGIEALIFGRIKTTDGRGNEILVPDWEHPQRARVWFQPFRSSRAELPGQQEIYQAWLGVASHYEDWRTYEVHELVGADTWAVVEFAGAQWDVAAPALRHYGTRDVDHWTVALRKRPTNFKGVFV